MAAKPKTKTESILAVAAVAPTLTPPEIARTCGTSRQMVHTVLARYGIEQANVDNYKQHRAEILAGLQDKIISTIDDDAIKAAPLAARAATYGILFDKERLERGQATGNINVLVGYIQDLQRATDAG